MSTPARSQFLEDLMRRAVLVDGSRTIAERIVTAHHARMSCFVEGIFRQQAMVQNERVLIRTILLTTRRCHSAWRWR
jgi:hypothetical protein